MRYYTLKLTGLDRGITMFHAFHMGKRPRNKRVPKDLSKLAAYIVEKATSEPSPARPKLKESRKEKKRHKTES